MPSSATSDVGHCHPILFVHHRSELGGAPTSLSYLIHALDPSEFDVHIFCPRGEVEELFRSAGATVHTGAVSTFTHIWASTYKGRRWLLFGRELLRLPKHVHDFRRVLRSHRFALVHLNDSPLIPAAFLARRAGLPVVWHLRSALPDNDRGLRARLLRSAIRRWGAASIAINDDVAASFSLGSTIIPNSVDLTRFRPSDAADDRARLDLPLDRPVVAYFGFLYPSKGFREFLQVAALLTERGLDATYLVVGGAVRSESYFRTFVGRTLLLLDLTRNYEREAHRLVGELGLEDHVRFIPFTRETAEIYRATDIVVAPSRGPELGRPLIEAAASGVPVVATGSRTGGGVMVAGETGRLVEDFGVETLADSVGGLLAAPELRREMGAAARRHAEDKFDPVRNARRVAAIFEELVGRPGRVKVLFVHHRPQLGGAPSSLAHLMRSLDHRFEPHVLTPEGPAADLFRSAGATVHTGPAAIFAHAWDNPYEGLRWLILGRELVALPGHLAAMRRLMRAHRFPIVHLNDSPVLPAAQVAHRHGAKVVWHLRSALAGEGRDRRSRAIARLIDRWGDAAIAIDRDVAARFPIHLPLTIIANSVAPPRLPISTDEAKLRLGLPHDRVVIGFAGFVRRQKGWPELVAAADILAEEGARAHFVIMGGGVRPPEYFNTVKGRLLALAKVITDEESAIKDLVAECGLTESFSFFPFTLDTDEIYAALDVIAFPNQGVGLGRPVLEAAMYGKPVVASGSANGGGILLPGETGILLDEPTPENIARALRTLAEDPGLRERLGDAAARHARVAFDSERNARAVEAVYDSLLAPSTARRKMEAAA